MFVQTRGTGPSLVLLHGWGLNSGVWEPVCHTLCEHFRVTLIDLPGFGRNREILPEDYSLESVSQLVGECIPDDSIVLGWSMGGLIAQQLVLSEHPAIRELVLLASTPRFVEAPDWPGIRLSVLQVFEQQLEKDFSKTLDRFLAIQALGSETAKQDIKVVRNHVQDYPLPSDKALGAGLGLLSSVDLRHRARDIRIPVTALFGRLDSLVPHRVMTEFESLYADVRLHMFDKASHAPFISHPEEFVQVMRALQR